MGEPRHVRLSSGFLIQYFASPPFATEGLRNARAPLFRFLGYLAVAAIRASSDRALLVWMTWPIGSKPCAMPACLDDSGLVANDPDHY
jgi:hypothetical protein